MHANLLEPTKAFTLRKSHRIGLGHQLDRRRNTEKKNYNLWIVSCNCWCCCWTVSVRSRSNWNLKVLVFEERGKPGYPEKNLSEQGREPTTNSTHIWRGCQDSNPGHIGGRRVLSPLRHPCSPKEYICKITRRRCRLKGTSTSAKR